MNKLPNKLRGRSKKSPLLQQENAACRYLMVEYHGFLVRLDCSADRPRLTLALFNKREGYTTFAYTDHDNQLFCTGIDSISVHQGMKADLLAFTGWFSSNGLAVNRTIAR